MNQLALIVLVLTVLCLLGSIGFAFWNNMEIHTPPSIATLLQSAKTEGIEPFYLEECQSLTCNGYYNNSGATSGANLFKDAPPPPAPCVFDSSRGSVGSTLVITLFTERDFNGSYIMLGQGLYDDAILKSKGISPACVASIRFNQYFSAEFTDASGKTTTHSSDISDFKNIQLPWVSLKVIYSPPPPPPPVPQDICNSPAYMDIFKEFYDKRGQWAGVYTMKPVKAITSGDSYSEKCSVLYDYINISGVATGSDRRLFTMNQDRTGNFPPSVAYMGPYLSGSSQLGQVGMGITH